MFILQTFNCKLGRHTDREMETRIGWCTSRLLDSWTRRKLDKRTFGRTDMNIVMIEKTKWLINKQFNKINQEGSNSVHIVNELNHFIIHRLKYNDHSNSSKLAGLGNQHKLIAIPILGGQHCRELLKS